MKKIDYKRVDDKLDLIALDDEDAVGMSLLTCGQKDCKNKTVISLKIPQVMNGLNVEGLSPLCREHLEDFYNQGIFEGMNNINHLKMIEGIIKYGSMEEWINREKSQ